MRILFLAAPLALIASPAATAEPYVELGLGVMDARANDVDQRIDFSATQTPSSPIVTGAADKFVDDVFGTRSKQGPQVTVAGGYDFGWLRLEGELGRHQVRTSRIAADDATPDFLTQLNVGLNRPSAAPDPGAPGLAPVTLADFQRGGHIRATTAMVNAIADWKVAHRLTVFAGGGYGKSWVRGFDAKDSAPAWQYMLGLRVPVSERMEVGVKHRYLNAGFVTLVEDPRSFAGNVDAVTSGGTVVNRLTSAEVRQVFEGNWRSRSVQLTLGYKF